MGSGRLKPGWTQVAFGDVVRQVKDRTDPRTAGLDRYVGGEHMDTDDLRIRRWGTIGDSYLGPAFHMRFQPGHVLYGSRRTYLRKVAVADFEGITANTTFVIESRDPKRLLPDLLPFVMQTESFHDHSIKKSRGSVNPYVNFSDLTSYEFALPPLAEQQRIVSVLTAVSSLKNSLVHARKHIDIVLQSTTNELISSVTSRTSHLARLEDVCVLIVDGTHQPPQFSSSGVPFLLVGNIKDGHINWNAKKHVSFTTFKMLSKSWRPQIGDVLYSLVGSFGVPAMVRVNSLFAFQRHIGLIRTAPDVLNSRFLYWYLRSYNGRSQAYRRAEGLAQKSITLHALRHFTVPIPIRPVQDETVNRLERLQGVADLVASRYRHIVRLESLLVEQENRSRNEQNERVAVS